MKSSARPLGESLGTGWCIPPAAQRRPAAERRQQFQSAKVPAQEVRGSFSKAVRSSPCATLSPLTRQSAQAAVIRKTLRKWDNLKCCPNGHTNALGKAPFFDLYQSRLRENFGFEYMTKVTPPECFHRREDRSSSAAGCMGNSIGLNGMQPASCHAERPAADALRLCYARLPSLGSAPPLGLNACSCESIPVSGRQEWIH